MIRCAALTSLHDETPEGKSTLELARRLGDNNQEAEGSSFIEFTAQTRMSGVDLPGGTKIRKGAADAIEQYIKGLGGKIPADLHEQVNSISSLGGTPLTVCENDRILGVIYLKDTVKPGMVERFERLRAIGIKTIMSVSYTHLITRIENGNIHLQMNAELLDDVFQEALSHLDRQAKDHEISVELPDDLLMAKMDARLIIQVIINIVNNAIKYTPSGSHIVLRAEKRRSMVAVSISDDGPGISDEAKTHLFDMFYTASQGKPDNRRGLGLGLNLCRSIVTAHGGEIAVTDNVPHGSIFTFTLPLEEVEIPHV